MHSRKGTVKCCLSKKDDIQLRLQCYEICNKFSVTQIFKDYTSSCDGYHLEMLEGLKLILEAYAKGLKQWFVELDV